MDSCLESIVLSNGKNHRGLERIQGPQSLEVAGGDLFTKSLWGDQLWGWTHLATGTSHEAIILP